MENITNCLLEVSRALDARGIGPGSIQHTIAQLQNAFHQEAQGFAFQLEQRIQTEIRGARATIEVDRIIDVVSQRVGNQLALLTHTEVKTGGQAATAANYAQMVQDAVIAIEHTLPGQIQSALRNVWQFTNLQMDQLRPVIEQRMIQVRDLLRAAGLTEEQVRAAVGSFSFVDAAGRAIRATMDAQGNVIFQPAMEEMSRKLEQAAEGEMAGSPNFRPAMEIALGPSGKLADAAQDAAQQVNLQPAMEALEEKIEQGVGGALNDAGTQAANRAGQQLGSQVAAGATALGNILTSVPQLHQSVTQLGEAWNRPLRSTSDYMQLFSAAGNVIQQGVQVFQALAAVTQIASAAQGVLNAVMAMNPIVLIVMAVIALIAAIVALIVYWDQVKAALRDNPWLSVIAVLFGVIGVIVLIIAYWDEIKLAVLQAANYVSIQVQRIGAFFAGLATLVGQVWDFIVAMAVNAGIGVINAFITAGTAVQNFFIGLINTILSAYNAIAESVIGDVLGLEAAEMIPEVAVETRLIPPREVPQVSVEAAFASTEPITGGLEDQIAAQERVVAQARQEDEARRQRQREEDARRERERQAAQPAAGAAPAAALPALPTSAAPGVAPAAVPGVPGAAGAPGGGGMSVQVQGGITVNINAERMELDAAEVLSDEIVQQLRARLEALGSEASFRTGTRQPAPA
jgi:hypothetical protein